MKLQSLAIIVAFVSLQVACATTKAPVVATSESSVSSDDAWHPQEDGLQLPEAPQAKRREEAPLGSLVPSRRAPTHGQLVNIGSKK